MGAYYNVKMSIVRERTVILLLDTSASPQRTLEESAAAEQAKHAKPCYDEVEVRYSIFRSSSRWFEYLLIVLAVELSFVFFFSALFACEK